MKENQSGDSIAILDAATDPMPLSKLRSILSAVKVDQPFTITSNDLGIDSITRLFNDDLHLPHSILTVASPAADPDALLLSGKITFPNHYDNLTAEITFFADSTKTNVSGISIRARMAKWENINLGFFTFSVSDISCLQKQFQCSNLYIVLRATSDYNTPQYGIGTDIPFGSSKTSLPIKAFLPADTKMGYDYRFNGLFNNIPLTKLEDLIEFAPGCEFKIPGLIPQDSLSLQGLSLTIDPTLSAIIVTSLNVQIAKEWNLIPGLFEFLALNATFVIPKQSKNVYFGIYTQFHLDPLPIMDVSISSDLFIEIALEESVQLSAVLKAFQLPPFIDFTIDYLRISFNAHNKDYSIQCTTSESWPSFDFIKKIFFNITSQGDSKKTFLVGAIFQLTDTIGIQATIDNSTGDTILTGWRKAFNKQYLKIADLLKFFNINVPELPFDLNLDSIAISYNLSKQAFALIADSVTYGTVTFVAIPDGQKNLKYFFGLRIEETLNLSDLPLIDKITNDQISVTIDQIQFLFSSGIAGSFINEANELINNLISVAGEGKTYPLIAPEGAKNDVGFSMTIHFGGDSVVFSLSTQNKSSNLLGDTNSGLIKWFDIQKNLGPISFQKIGIRYKDGKLGFLINAGLSSSGLTISLIEFGIESPLTTFTPDFTISGLGILFEQGDVEISGSLIGSLSPVNFTGELVLGCSELTIAAIGAYALVEDKPSFFLYAMLDYPIGGPSFFFITGLAAGFGFNRKLLIPDLSGVATFPFIEWAMGLNSPSSMDDALSSLTTSGIVAPSLGEDWLAIGIRFTSFEFIDSFALVTITFGTDFELDILGLSKAALPDKNFAVAYVELEIKATFSPSKGLLGIAGQLTPNSYVFTKNCHLTGGFAYYFWFSGDHAGNFVMTLGGYGPLFNPPSFYPQVARLGLNWQIDSDTSIDGDLYYALTSCAIMAGGGFHALWNCGDIRAWFGVEADFLIVFIPFHYYMDGDIDLGASFSISLLFFDITITIHLGVDVAIWGPDFAGKAKVDLSIISFTVHFGADSSPSTNTKVQWSDFYNKLLPKQQPSSPSSLLQGTTPPPAILQINLTGGLIKKISEVPGNINFIVNGEQFEVKITSAIPFKVEGKPPFKENISAAPDSYQPKDGQGNLIQVNNVFGIGPTHTENDDLESTLNIDIDREDSSLWYINEFRNIPTALWKTREFNKNGVPVNLNLGDATIDNVMNGYRLIPEPAKANQTREIDLKTLVFETDDIPPQKFAWSTQIPQITDPFKDETVSSTISSSQAKKNLSQFILYLNSVELTEMKDLTDIDVSDLANGATSDLLATPILRLLGEQKEVSV